MALPDGTTFLPPDHLPFFANYSITFWFPDTIGSFDACKSFAKKIGEEKCRTMTRDIPQPSVSLMKAQKDVASYIRQNSFGKIIITVFPPIIISHFGLPILSAHLMPVNLLLKRLTNKNVGH